MTNLQENALSHMRGTLEDLASSARQVKYKRAVPFVHVPHELLAQWDSYVRLIQEADWFRSLFSDSDRAALLAYDERVGRFRDMQGERCPDVDAVLVDPEWRKLMQGAAELLAELQLPPNGT